MKKTLFPLAVLLLFFGLCMTAFAVDEPQAQYVQKDHVVYELEEAGKNREAHYAVRSFFDSKEAAESVTNLSVLSEIDGIPVTEIAIDVNLLFGKTAYAVETIALPDSITSISRGAFQGMAKLKEIRIPQGVEEIGNDTFSGCAALKTVVLPTTLKTIGKCAFLDCTSLEKISLPRFLTYIGPYALTRTSVRKLTIPAHCGFENLSFSNCPKLETVRFANRKSLLLEDWMFFACPLLKTVVLPKTTDGVTIHANCFADCAALSKIKNADRIIAIGAKAFANCTSLSSFTVSTQTTRIDRLSFSGCESLKKLRVLTTDQTMLVHPAFLRTLPKSCKVYVKTEEMKQAFLDAGCKNKVIVKADLK